ncbi:MAG: bis(5'-nucleosyl)-tetraphosphatase (symmetrical) YqeK [Erysipelotrichaceae bacterium]|nr:bis(5'-nucleosyl)-tetraphosphatase (symmetrical) YqeK [Erysipelotrichaceae bacterium]
MKRIGLITGYFDPINILDIDLAKTALKRLNLDKIGFFVKPGSNYQHRFNMVKQAIGPYRHLMIAENIEEKYFAIIDPRLDQGLISDDFLNVPRTISRYAIDHCLYFDRLVFKQVSRKRYEHIRSTAELARDLAAHYHLNSEHARVAGYLHDYTKEWPKEKQMQTVLRYFPEHIKENAKVYHQYTAGLTARQLFQIRQTDILDAISNHVNGTDRKRLSRIIFCADKVEDTRGFDNTEIKTLCFRNIDQAFDLIRSEQLNYIKGARNE